MTIANWLFILNRKALSHGSTYVHLDFVEDDGDRGEAFGWWGLAFAFPVSCIENGESVEGEIDEKQ